jgi:hypothetical protein
MKTVIVIATILLYGMLVRAQDYDVAKIPSALRNRAVAVIRDSKTVVDMRSPTNVSINITKAVTVFNKTGERYGELVLFYDKNISIKGVKGEILNEFGKPLSKFSLSNFKDESAINDFSLYEDSRIKYYIPQVTEYPYTIVYTYEVKHKQNLIIPEWRPVPGFDVSVEKSSYEFIHSPGDELRVHTVNYAAKPEEVVAEKQQSLLWKVTDVRAIKHEAFSPNEDHYFTSVRIAPKNFSYYNFKGSYTDWQGLGQLSYDYLLKDRRELPPETIETIKELVKNEADVKTKAKKIYQYMQQKTRYISVQIGIGGFRPIKAAEVDRLGYGDCKGLVNYMQSLLDVAGIESYYCVVSAGEDKTSLIPSFASMEQGNHIILCLPLKGDTTWLECTSQDAPFGYLGSFTDDRWVLACTENGGKLLRTPKFEPASSVQKRNADLTLYKNGNVEGTLTTSFKGSQFENHYFLLNKLGAEREKQLKYIYDINNITFTNIDLSADKNIPVFNEKLAVSINNYAAVNNGKLFIAPNLFNVKRTVPSVRNRELPFEIKRGYVDIDSVTFKLADGIVPVLFPKNIKIENKFGFYEVDIRMKDKQISYYRKLMLNDGKYTSTDYEAFETFINEVAGNDKLRFALSLAK